MNGELIQLNEVIQTLIDLANDIEENYKEHLAQSGRYTLDYGLIDSVKCDVQVNDRGYEVIMRLNDYWKYVENDTKPHFPPLDSILQWIQIKPIIPRPDNNGKIPTPKQLAYLIGRAMAGQSPNQQNCKNPNGGTTGTHDLERTKDAILPIYKERLSIALGHDVENYIMKLVRD